MADQVDICQVFLIQDVTVLFVLSISHVLSSCMAASARLQKEQNQFQLLPGNHLR